MFEEQYKDLLELSPAQVIREKFLIPFVENVNNLPTRDYRELVPLQETEQGSLKDMYLENMAALKLVMTRRGFRFPFRVVIIEEEGNKEFLHDGHGRRRLFMSCPPHDINGDPIYQFPVNIITAKTKAEAIELLLEDNSRYHTMTQEGYDLITEVHGISQVWADKAFVFERVFTFDTSKLGDDQTDQDDDDKQHHDDDKVPQVEENEEEHITAKGDLYELVNITKGLAHRVHCGNSTDPHTVQKTLQGKPCDLMVTDPPYSSGGFQESGRAAGSIGTRRESGDVEILQDNLSSRGYQSLIRQTLMISDCANAYIFTDWRMWVYLFDIVESCGLKTRSMIVWDKGYPGLGVGWRAQHELCMMATKQKTPFTNKTNRGNVISEKRSGNALHYTQKPVSLIIEFLKLHPTIKTVYDPFLGSGTTIIASEETGKNCHGQELYPGYADVIVERWVNYMKEKGYEYAVKRNGQPCNDF